MKRLTREQLAARVARDIPEGAYVNLGIGMPTLVANYLPRDREIFLHSENGILGMGPAPAPGEEDPDLINAGKQPVTLLPGGSFFHHADSFAMMRGGHLDIIAKEDRKSTRLNSSHLVISYAVFCLKKKKHIHKQNK